MYKLKGQFSNKENWSVQLIRPAGPFSWSIQLVRPAGLFSWSVQLVCLGGLSSWSDYQTQLHIASYTFILHVASNTLNLTNFI